MRRFGVMILVLLTGLSGAAFVYRQPIADWYRLRDYTPPAEVAALADDTTMLADTRRLFYVNRPAITDKDDFNTHCRDSEHTIVLGCFLPGEQAIYLLNVTDERLAGIKEVTAAHELLHAAYERLSDSERQRVDTLVTEAYRNVTDSRIRETVDLYRKQDPSVVPNELHSILGTEVRSLPTELEDYYKRYFSDRTRIVRYSEQYEQAFTVRRNAVRDFDARLAELKSEINARTTVLKAEDASLQQMRQQMNSLRANGKTEEYNAMVPEYNSRVNSYNAGIDEVGDLIVQYNDIVQQRNAVAAEEDDLVKAIDSRDVVPDQR